MSIYGVDFGNSKACIATFDSNGNPIVIPNLADASDELAAVVYFENEDNVIVGSFAKDMVETDGERVVQFVKREIGKPNAHTYEFDGKTYTPVEISALILGRLKQMVEEQGGSVDDVVITCPAYFGLEERNATKKAGELAGMNVLGLIDEPSAAALSYCARQFRNGCTVLVYDLGGVTFDVTIVKMSLVIDADGNEVQKLNIIATGGNDELGGKDWDDKLFDHILQACCDENGLTTDEIDVETRQLIRSRVETTKKKLSNVVRAKVRINVDDDLTSINISREEFESLTSDKVAQTMACVEDTLQRAGNIEIDAVLLVGGSARMPMIRNAVEARFPGKVQIEDPEHAAAIGAAICGHMLCGNPIPTPPPKRQSINSYSLDMLANMLGYLLDHSHEDIAKELISEIDWEQLTHEQLFNFVNRIRNLCMTKCGYEMDNDSKMEYIEKILRAAIIAMDALSPIASEYLLKEIPWGTLSTDEILKLITIVKTCPREVPEKVLKRG